MNMSFQSITGSENEKAIDISKLRGQTGYVTIDPGFKNTGATTSAITYLDGEEGILRYRGYSIEELADKADFLGVSYLLIYGELPNKAQYDDFVNRITRHTMVNEDMRKIFDGFPVNAHPMGIMSSLVSAMSGFYPSSYDEKSTDEIDFTSFDCWQSYQHLQLGVIRSLKDILSTILRTVWTIVQISFT